MRQYCTRASVLFGASLICAATPFLVYGWPQKAATLVDLPRIVAPGPTASDPPADAVVLFDGTAASLAAHWVHADGRPAQWEVDQAAGCMTIKPGSGSILSVEKFGNAQIHVEFATPTPVTGEGQGRGNSGVYMQGLYEVQVLDSYENETYPDGQCGAIYGKHPPLVNAARAPGEWQTYDIVFRAPVYDGESGRWTSPGTMTVFHNGVLVQDHAEFLGSTTAAMGAVEAHNAPGPLYLQDHGHRVRYRNIWFRLL